MSDDDPAEDHPEESDGDGADPDEAEETEQRAEHGDPEESAAASTDDGTDDEEPDDEEAVDAGEETGTETDEVESETDEPVDDSPPDENADPDSEDDESDEGEREGASESEEDEGAESGGESDAANEEPEGGVPAVSAEDLDARLDEAEAELEAAETESDLDAVESTLDDVEADIEAADLPEPEEGEDDEEEAADPREELESRLSDLRDGVEEKRGPYAEEVVTDIEEAQSTIRDTRWTEQGLTELAAPVGSFLDDVNGILGTELSQTGSNPEGLASDLDDAVAAVEAENLDPDDDGDTIAELLEATDALASGLDDAQEWDDLETHEKLQAQGYYDVLGHYKDFPPEWAAMKEWEKRGNVEMVLLALDSLQSEFMEDHAMETLIRMGDREAFEEMHQRAGKRDKPAIRALGTMAAEDAVETLVEYVDADSDPALQKATFKALGQIGHPDAVQPLANKLVMDDDNVRPVAARALGLIGDTRAVGPLADSLAGDESASVRAAAAWALRQIGTEEALRAVARHDDDRAYIVQAEVEKANAALSDDEEAEAAA